MPAVRIVTDSACDLTDQLARSHNIIVVPLTIRFGDEELVDRRDLDPQEFWRRCRLERALPETAAPSPGAFQQAFESAAKDGYDSVLCLTISAGVSATYQAARAAAEECRALPVTVIDTRSLTMGQGLLAISAAEVATSGASLSEVADHVAEAMDRTRVFGAIDTLDHLQRGGRIGAARALLGSILSIKPVVEVRDGIVAEESRQRTRMKSLRYLADKVRSDAPLSRLAICDGAAPDIETFVEMLHDVPVAGETIRVALGPVVGTHAGPGSIGVCYQIAAPSSSVAPPSDPGVAGSDDSSG